jgi:hypothetical protein
MKSPVFKKLKPAEKIVFSRLVKTELGYGCLSRTGLDISEKLLISKAQTLHRESEKGQYPELFVKKIVIINLKEGVVL